MDRDAVIAMLREHEQELRELGIARLSLFGSVARGEAGADSDVDLAARFDPDRRIGLFEYGGIAYRLEQLIGRTIDLVSEPIRKDRLRARVERDRVLVF